MVNRILTNSAQYGSSLSKQLPSLFMLAAVGSSVTFGQGALPITGVSSIEEQLTTRDKAIQNLEHTLNKARQDLEALVSAKFELETPEVFILRPLSSRQITVKVLKVEPARFYFIADDISLKDMDNRE